MHCEGKGGTIIFATYMKIDRLQNIYFSIITVQHSCSAAIFLNNSSVRMRAPGKQVLQIQRQSWTQAGTADSTIGLIWGVIIFTRASWPLARCGTTGWTLWLSDMEPCFLSSGQCVAL